MRVLVPYSRRALLDLKYHFSYRIIVKTIYIRLPYFHNSTVLLPLPPFR